MPTIAKQYGKKPYVPSDSDLQFSDVFEPLATTPGVQWGHYELLEGGLYDFDFPLGMLANDKLGDCEIAGQDHGQMLDDAEAGRPIPEFDDATATADYSAVGGYVPGKPETDQGLETRETLAYRRKTGMASVDKKRHKIGIFGELPFADLDYLDAVGQTTGKIALGTAITNEAAAQFDRAEPFDLGGDEDLDGYHFVYVVGKLAGNFVVITWGTFALMTPRYLQAKADEAWAYATGAQINPQSNDTLAGLDVEKARAFIHGLKGGKK